MKRLIKKSLLRFGGYTFARDLHRGFERRAFFQDIKKFLDTGNTPLPDMIMFEPTQRCNLHCKMCYQQRNIFADNKELTKEQIIDFFNRYPYLKKVTLIGGEIFMRHDIIDIICDLDHSRDIVLSTNGTLIGDSQIDKLRNCKHIFTICISLDGPKEVHEIIRGVPGSYNKTVNTIKALAVVFPITVNCVIQNENITVFPDVIDLCAEMGVKKVNFELERIYSEEAIVQSKALTGLEATDISISSKGRVRGYSLEILQSKLYECQRRAKKAGIYVTFDPPFLTQEIEACYAGDLRTKTRSYCQGFRMATVAPNGDLIHCYAIRKSFGNILKESFDVLWNSEAAKGFREQLLKKNLTPLCENCPFLSPCK
jgi:radical SAM protein with 4Fe4S-binding SPASM domain